MNFVIFWRWSSMNSGRGNWLALGGMWSEMRAVYIHHIVGLTVGLFHIKQIPLYFLWGMILPLGLVCLQVQARES